MLSGGPTCPLLYYPYPLTKQLLSPGGPTHYVVTLSKYLAGNKLSYLIKIESGMISQCVGSPGLSRQVMSFPGFAEPSWTTLQPGLLTVNPSGLSNLFVRMGVREPEGGPVSLSKCSEIRIPALNHNQKTLSATPLKSFYFLKMIAKLLLILIFNLFREDPMESLSSCLLTISNDPTSLSEHDYAKEIITQKISEIYKTIKNLKGKNDLSISFWPNEKFNIAASFSEFMRPREPFKCEHCEKVIEITKITINNIHNDETLKTSNIALHMLIKHKELVKFNDFIDLRQACKVFELDIFPKDENMTQNQIIQKKKDDEILSLLNTSTKKISESIENVINSGNQNENFDPKFVYVPNELQKMGYDFCHLCEPKKKLGSERGIIVNNETEEFFRISTLMRHMLGKHGFLETDPVLRNEPQFLCKVLNLTPHLEKI